jgi:hypothetical protein
MSRAGLAAVFALSLFGSMPAFGRQDGRYMNKVTTDFETSHEKWGRPYAHGKIRVLWIGAPGGQYRLISELAQRFDMEFEAVVCYGGPDAPGSTDSYVVRAEGNTPAEKKRELAQKLAKDYDVIVLSWPMKDLPPVAKYRIVKSIVDGAGFIGEMEKGMPELEANLPDADLGFLVQNLSTEPSLKGSDGKPRFTAGALGKGRWLGGGVGFGETGDPWRDALICDLNCMSWANRLAWLAGKPPRYSVEYATPQGQTFKQAELREAAFRFTVKPSAAAPAKYSVLVRVKDESGSVLHEKAAAGDGQQAFALGLLRDGEQALAAGKYYVDVRVSSKAGNEFWATKSIQVAAPYSLKVTVAKPSLKRGEAVEAAAEFVEPADPGRSKPVQGGMDIEAQTIDGYGRISAVKVFPVKPEAVRTTLSMPNQYPVCIGNRLVVTLRQGGVPLCRAEAEFFVPEDPWERFPSVLWPTGVNGTYFSWLNDLQSRRGWFTHYLYVDDPKVARRLAFADLGIAPMVCFVQLGANPDGWTTHWLHPQWGLNDPEATIFSPKVQEMYRGRAKDFVERLRVFRPFCYNLGDENGFTYDGGYSPHEIQAFRKFLQERYESLKDMNETWGTKFGAWDEIDAAAVKAAVADKANYPARHDHWSFMEYQFVMFHHVIGGFLREFDPEAEFGLEGSSGGDLELMLSKCRLFCPYADRGHNAQVTSFAPEGERMIQANWWGGYSGGGGRQLGAENLWSQVISGFSNSSWWFTQNDIEGFISVDLRHAEYFSERFLDGLRQICGGVGQQLNEYRLVDDGVAIHSSQPSSHVGSCFPAFGNAGRTFLSLMDRIGVSSRFISHRQVLAGKLAWPGRKLLFMPASHAIGRKEAEKIADFVRSGGTVLAGYAPGMCNEHAKPLAKGHLDDLFGISRRGEPALVTTSLEWGQLKCSSTKADSAIQPGPDTEVLGKGKAPMVIVRKTGKGKTILLNFDLLAANGSVDPACGADFERVLSRLVREAGVKPLYDLEGTYSRLTIFPKPGTTLVGVITGLSQDKAATIRLGDPKHVYDVRAGKYLGQMSEIRFDPSSARSFLFAVQDEPVGRVSVKSGRSVKPGEVIEGQVDLGYAPDPGESRVVRIETRDALGRDRSELRLYPRTNKRKVKFAVPVAWNDPPGKYLVRAVDILTGAIGETEITVEKR